MQRCQTSSIYKMTRIINKHDINHTSYFLQLFINQPLFLLDLLKAVWFIYYYDYQAKRCKFCSLWR